MARVYAFCGNGHLFAVPVCALDGWESEVSRELEHGAGALASAHAEASIARLRSVGVSERSLAAAVILDPVNRASFDALAPREIRHHVPDPKEGELEAEMRRRGIPKGEVGDADWVRRLRKAWNEDARPE